MDTVVSGKACSAVLFENDDWFVVDKPTGISTHGAFPGDVALQEWMELHWDKKTYVCSRLDKGTSGVLVFAKNSQASARAQRIHEEYAALKEYVFLSNRSHPKISAIQSWTSEESLDGLACKTEFRLIKSLNGMCLYSAKIERGRMHQIRRHAAAAGIPVLGDLEYGGAQGAQGTRLFLHCWKTQWPEIDSILESPIPESFLLTNAEQRAVCVALERRGKLLESVCNAYRCVHRGELELDCAIDRYGDFLCVWDYESNLQEDAVLQFVKSKCEFICRALHLNGWVVKRAVRNPHSNRLVSSQHVFGKTPPAFFEVFEHGIFYRVSLTESQHVGLFLDQRDNRRLLWKIVQGWRVANLFAYTCSFSVAAAAAQAEVVFSVDAAKKYLDVGVTNFEINSLSQSRRGKFITEDVRSWLARQERKIEREGAQALFDAIVCDPPTFSSTAAKGEFSVANEWGELARMCSRILQRTGCAFFSTNHRAGERADYEGLLKKFFEKVERRSQPLDFPVLPGEPEHVKLFLCSMPILLS